ncbi:UNVERIFIED_CONTAM: hypothetical protein NCL1_55030 [Trichonephila clavipes]
MNPLDSVEEETAVPINFSFTQACSPRFIGVELYHLPKSSLIISFNSSMALKAVSS